MNTNPHYIGRETYGFAVTKIITSIKKGSHHQISRLSDGEELVVFNQQIVFSVLI